MAKRETLPVDFDKLLPGDGEDVEFLADETPDDVLDAPPEKEEELEEKVRGKKGAPVAKKSAEKAKDNGKTDLTLSDLLVSLKLTEAKVDNLLEGTTKLAKGLTDLVKAQTLSHKLLEGITAPASSEKSPPGEAYGPLFDVIGRIKGHPGFPLDGLVKRISEKYGDQLGELVILIAKAHGVEFETETKTFRG